MLLLYMSVTLETYLKSLNLISLKAIAKFHNAYQKIKIAGKKAQLIEQLLLKYDEITDGHLKGKLYNTPTFDIKPPPRKDSEAKEAKKKERDEVKKNKLMNKQRAEQAIKSLSAKIAEKKRLSLLK